MTRLEEIDGLLKEISRLNEKSDKRDLDRIILLKERLAKLREASPVK